MSTQISMRIYDLVLIIVGALQFAAGLYMGYWMARNAQDKPVRSPYRYHNPSRDKDPVGEPGGDLYEIAMEEEEYEERVRQHETGM